MLLEWDWDEDTAYWAGRIENPVTWLPKSQDVGPFKGFRTEIWGRHLLASEFPADCLDPLRPGTLRCSPENIVRCCECKDLLEALALTGAWGAMSRRLHAIYTRLLPELSAILLAARTGIEATGSIEGVWGLLTGSLRWSDVLTSKYLHFLAWSLGYARNAPAPIDTLVIVKVVWPQFRSSRHDIRRAGEPNLPRPWREPGYAWPGYNRYMTAIACWATDKGWTTTQLEYTLYEQYYPRKQPLPANSLCKRSTYRTDCCTSLCG